MDFTFFNQLILILGLSVCAIALFHRFNLPESLAYLAVGILVGPTATGLIHSDFDISLLAEIGVVFLLFTLGLEFSLSRMKTMRQEVFGLGGLQVLLCSVGIFAALQALGIGIRESLIIAAALALSSTAIVSKELTQSNEIRARQGQLAIGILLFQDIAAVFFLILVPALAGSGGDAILPAIGMALAKGILFVVMMLAIGKWVLPTVFNEIAKARSEELFVLVALMIALMAAWLTHMLELSMALGGFIAGMMLGDSNYKHQVETDIRPFRDILLGLFFVSVGLMLDLDILLQHWPVIIAATVALLLFKLSVITVLATTFGEKRRIALKAGLALCQGGEFCFALIALATQYGQTGGEKASLVLSATILSMIVAPLLIRNSARIADQFSPRTEEKMITAAEADIQKQVAHIRGHTLICGYGRVGQTISRFLARENLPYVAVDDDALHVHEAGLAGEPVFYGDCRSLELLEAVGLNRASHVIICIDKTDNALEVVRTIRQHCQYMPVLVRTRDLSKGDELKQAGATTIVPEVLESSLLIVKQVFLMMGMDRDIVRHKIHQAREQQYNILSGYYPGVGDIYADNQEAQRHAITLMDNSPACGLEPGTLELPDEVSLICIKRDGQDCTPDSIEELTSGDIIILAGPMASLQQAEKDLI